MSAIINCFGSYNKGLSVDVMEVERQDVVLAAHVHAVVILIHAQDAIV